MTSQESNGAAVSVQILRVPRNSSTVLTPASAVGRERAIFVVPESVLGAPLKAIAGLAGVGRGCVGGPGT